MLKSSSFNNSSCRPFLLFLQPSPPVIQRSTTTYSCYDETYKLLLQPSWGQQASPPTLLWLQAPPQAILKHTSSSLAILRLQVPTVLRPTSSNSSHHETYKLLLLPPWGLQAPASTILKPTSPYSSHLQSYKYFLLPSWGLQAHKVPSFIIISSSIVQISVTCLWLILT